MRSPGSTKPISTVAVIDYGVDVSRSEYQAVRRERVGFFGHFHLVQAQWRAKAECNGLTEPSEDRRALGRRRRRRTCCFKFALSSSPESRFQVRPAPFHATPHRPCSGRASERCDLANASRGPTPELQDVPSAARAPHVYAASASSASCRWHAVLCRSHRSLLDLTDYRGESNHTRKSLARCPHCCAEVRCTPHDRLHCAN